MTKKCHLENVCTLTSQGDKGILKLITPNISWIYSYSHDETYRMFQIFLKHRETCVQMLETGFTLYGLDRKLGLYKLDMVSEYINTLERGIYVWHHSPNTLMRSRRHAI
jgi:hypothetical protein